MTQAEQHGGGWVQMSFHQICDGCEQYSTPLATLTAFLDWLQPRAATGTVVRTVQQALASSAPPVDATAPVTSIACNSAACTSGAYTAPVTVALTATDNGGSGVAATSYTTNGSDPTTTSTLYSAPFTVTATTTVKYRSWDASNNSEATKTQLVTISSGGGTGGTIEKAAGRPTSASSSENAGFAPQFANDGTTDTRWSSLFQNNQWWQVDLGSSRAITSATITFNQWAWPKTYTISTSPDATTWTIIANATNTTSGTKTTTFTQTTSRYIRITGLTRGTSAGTSIEEALIYGPTDGTPPPTDTTAPGDLDRV